MKHKLPSQRSPKTDLEAKFNIFMEKMIPPGTDNRAVLDIVQNNHQKMLNLFLADEKIDIKSESSVRARLLDTILSSNNDEFLKLLIAHDKPTKRVLLEKGIPLTENNVLRYYLQQGLITQLHYGETKGKKDLIALAKTLPNLPIVSIIVDRDFSEHAIAKLKEEGMLPMLINFNNIQSVKQRDLTQELEVIKKQCPDDIKNIPEYLLNNGGGNVQAVKKYAVQVAKLSDGIWLPGGTDIAPFFYHTQIKSIGRYGFDIIRTVFELALIEQQKNHPYLPIVGVCRGHQMINIAKGGTLIHHVSRQYGMQQLSPQIQRGILGEALSKNINTIIMHHQAINKLGEGLEIIASHQGIVKAAQGTDPSHPLLLLQFHPEENDDIENSIIIQHISTIFKTAEKQSSYIPDTNHPFKMMTYEKEVRNPTCLAREHSLRSTHAHFQPNKGPCTQPIVENNPAQKTQAVYDIDRMQLIPKAPSSNIIINVLLAIITLYLIRNTYHYFYNSSNKKLPPQKGTSCHLAPPSKQLRDLPNQLLL